MQAWSSSGANAGGFVVDAFEIRNTLDLDVMLVRDEFRRVNRYAATNQSAMHTPPMDVTTRSANSRLATTPMRSFATKSDEKP